MKKIKIHIYVRGDEALRHVIGVLNDWDYMLPLELRIKVRDSGDDMSIDGCDIVISASNILMESDVELFSKYTKDTVFWFESYFVRAFYRDGEKVSITSVEDYIKEVF